MSSYTRSRKTQRLGGLISLRRVQHDRDAKRLLSYFFAGPLAAVPWHLDQLAQQRFGKRVIHLAGRWILDQESQRRFGARAIPVNCSRSRAYSAGHSTLRPKSKSTKSFYGREDQTLTDKLLTELRGILNWAITGWRRLNNLVALAPSAGGEADMRRGGGQH